MVEICISSLNNEFNNYNAKDRDSEGQTNYWKPASSSIPTIFTNYDKNKLPLQIKRKEDGDATGEGYVKFAKQSEATTALEKHMEKLGHR